MPYGRRRFDLIESATQTDVENEGNPSHSGTGGLCSALSLDQHQDRSDTEDGRRPQGYDHGLCG